MLNEKIAYRITAQEAIRVTGGTMKGVVKHNHM